MSEGATSQGIETFDASSASRGGATDGGAKSDGAGSSAAERTGAGSILNRRAGRRREDHIVAASAAAQRAVDRAILAARSAQPVIVSGPAGSGKSMLARAVHVWSSQAAGPLEVLACSAVPEPLQGRELFGCAAGTYPGLPEAHTGVLAKASEGTLVLEGVDSLAPPVLAALGRALDTRRFRPEGSGEERPVSARVVATTERSLGDAPLAVPHEAIELPPRSERREDILPLAAHFLTLAAAELGVDAVGFTSEARAALLEESWSGNVAELRERIRQAVRLIGGGAISAEALMLSAPSGQVPSFREAKRAFEARYVETVLRLCDGNISQAARLARKDRKDFYDVIRRTGIDPAQFRR